MVHIFNMQGSSGGERCYFNLGVHLTFLPPEGGGSVEPSRLLEYHCMLRQRIEPPGAAHGWIYGESKSEAEATVALALKAWHEQAVPFFSRYLSSRRICPTGRTGTTRRMRCQAAA